MATKNAVKDLILKREVGMRVKQKLEDRKRRRDEENSKSQTLKDFMKVINDNGGLGDALVKEGAKFEVIKTRAADHRGYAVVVSYKRNRKEFPDSNFNTSLLSDMHAFLCKIFNFDDEGTVEGVRIDQLAEEEADKLSE